MKKFVANAFHKAKSSLNGRTRDPQGGEGSQNDSSDRDSTASVVSSHRAASSTNRSPVASVMTPSAAPPVPPPLPPKESPSAQAIYQEKNEEYQRNAPQKVFYCSPKTLQMLESRNKTLQKSLREEKETFFGEKSKKLIPLTTDQLNLRVDILQDILRGDIAHDKILREKPVTEIIMTLAAKSANFVQQLSPQERTAEREDLDSELVKFFQDVILSIKNDHTLDLQGKIFEAMLQPKPESIAMDSLPIKLDIEKPLTALHQHYKKTYDAYEETAFKTAPHEFVKTSCKHLNDLYLELLKLKLDDKNNHWENKSVQKALNYYFDQRLYVYKIYQMTQATLESLEKNLNMLEHFKEYITHHCARGERYTDWLYRLSQGRAHAGFDKWTKVNMAHWEYVFFCSLPGDIIPNPPPHLREHMVYASENGELEKLKRQAMSLGFGLRNNEDDPFTPLNTLNPITPLDIEPVRSNKAKI